MEGDLIVLIETTDISIANEIQSLLEESGVHSLIVSDDPASSVLNLYSGFNPFENITIKVVKADYQKAVEIIKDSVFNEFLLSSIQS